MDTAPPVEPVRFAVSAAARVPATLAFDRVVPRDDSTLFRGFLVLPAVVGVSDVSGAWSRAGETRTVHLSDGGSFRERILRFEPPDGSGSVGRFDYRVTDFTGALAHLVSDAEAEWRYEPHPNGGSRIVWRYAYRPLPRRRFVIRRLIGPLWSAYMRRGMAECVRVAEGD